MEETENKIESSSENTNWKWMNRHNVNCISLAGNNYLLFVQYFACMYLAMYTQY